MPRHAKPQNNGIPIKINPEEYDLPEIRPEEMKFCILIAQGGASQRELFKEAFNAHHWTDTAASTEASRLKSKPHIKKWIATLQIEAMKKGAITHAAYNIKLAELIEEARQQKQWGAVTGLMTTMGKSMGFLTDKVSVKNETAAELIESVKKLEGLNPAIAGIVKDQYSHYLPDLSEEKSSH